MTISVIIGILGTLIILESLFLLLFPMASNRFLRKISKDKQAIKKAGLIELTLGAILVAISYLIKLG